VQKELDRPGNRSRCWN